MISPEIDRLVQVLNSRAPVVSQRDIRYRGDVPLRYAADEVRGDLRRFGVNLYRLAVDAVAERMRIKRLTVMAGGRDVSRETVEVWQRSQMDQLLQPVLVDALALGAAYLIVWPDETGRVVITPESASQIAIERHPVTGTVTHAIKRWGTTGPAGQVESEHIVYYTPESATHYSRTGAGDWVASAPVDNPLGVVPVIPMVNFERVGDDYGHSVIDDLAPLVDALSKVLADMLVASEDVARPRRWASGVDLEDDEQEWTADGDGFTADATPEPVEPAPAAVSPFESGNRMFTVESPDAKFGQLPGADLQGYRTAVDLLVQQIMAVSALPAHMVGITSANPSSADAIRAAEASLTARADSRIRVLGIALERALELVAAILTGAAPNSCVATITWADPSTRSTAQETDAVTKLYAADLITTEEARERLDLEGL